MIKHASQNQFHDIKQSSFPSQRKKSKIDLQNSCNNLNSHFMIEKIKVANQLNNFKQIEIKYDTSNYPQNNFQPTFKPISNNSGSPQKKGYSHKNNASKDDLLSNRQEQTESTEMSKKIEQRKNSNFHIKLATSSDVIGTITQGDRFQTEPHSITSRNNISQAILQEQIENNKVNPPSRAQTANSYYIQKKKQENEIITLKVDKTNNKFIGPRSASNLQTNKRKNKQNTINSLHNIFDFEDTQIFQGFQQPYVQIQNNEPNNSQQIGSNQQLSTVYSNPSLKKDTPQKSFKLKTKSVSQLQTISGFQKLQKVKRALAFGTKVNQFLGALKQIPQQKYDKSSEQYSKECIQLLKGILLEKQSEVELIEQMDLVEDKSLLEGLDIQKNIKKNTEKLTSKILRAIQENIIEPITQRTYKGVYQEKCQELDKLKFVYQDMEKEVEVLRRNQQVFDDIAANYFRKSETIEKENQVLKEEKLAAKLEIERLENKLQEQLGYQTFWQGEYHQLNRKYNEDIYEIGQFEEKIKKEKTEKVFLENQLSILQKSVENKSRDLEKIKSAQVQLKWMKGSLSTYQQDMLNKNIQINLCKDLLISKSEALNLLPKEQLDKEQPLIDLIKLIFHEVAIKLN